MQKNQKDWNNIGEVDVIYRNGERRFFYDLEDAVEYVGWRIISHLKKGFIAYFYSHEYMDSWVESDAVEFRDELGLLIPLWKVREVAMNLGLPNKVRPWRYFDDHVYKFRDGPVKGTGKRRGYHCLRHMRTLQEARENDFLDYDEEMKEFGITVRGCRTRPNLPQAWDDVTRSDYYDRSWKKSRRHKWRD